jgi:hypothetical protein
MNEEINATNDTNNEVARLRWEIKISEEDGIPYLWDNRKYDNYDLGSLCRILNEYEETNNEVARLRELLNRAIDNCECEPKCSSHFASYCDCGRYARNEVIREELARLAPSPEEAPPKIQVIREKMSPEKAEEVRKIRHAYLKSVERDDFLTQENAHLRAVIKTLLWFTEPHPLDLDDINLWDKIESIYGPAEGILELADFTEKEAK